MLKLVNKDLRQWAADQVARWAADNWMWFGQRDEETAFRGSRFRWRDALDLRAEVGTGVHETIEAEHMGTWDYPDLNPEQDRIMLKWAEFKSEHFIVPHLSEATVRDHTIDIMGTLDGLWDIDGVRSLVDIKTSKNTYDEHWFQLSALGNADAVMRKVPEGEGALHVNSKTKEKTYWVEDPMFEFDQYAIVHLRDDVQELLTYKRNDPFMINAHKQYSAYRELYGLLQESKQIKKGG